VELFIEFMDEIQEGKEFKLNRLEENISSYFPRLYTLRHGFINWSWDTDEIENFICAFDDPYAGVSTFVDGLRVFLKKCQAEYKEGIFHPFMSGLVYRISNCSLFIATKDGALIVRSVVDENGNNIVKKLKVGQRFYTPNKYLEEAMLFNAEYDTEGLMKGGD
jgi:methionyl-tRNA formyltransferase